LAIPANSKGMPWSSYFEVFGVYKFEAGDRNPVLYLRQVYGAGMLLWDVIIIFLKVCKIRLNHQGRH
jgi:hypothetical protein